METDEAGVDAWIERVKPEHQSIVKRVDKIIRATIPNVQCTIKWRKPSQPLGVPFYGLEGRGWIVALWSFKEKFGIGFIAGTLLDPEPPVTSMAGPWNRGSDVKGRRIDIQDEAELDEDLLRLWLEQARELPGWSDL